MKTQQTPSPRKSVLVVCMLDSIHTFRWLENFQDSQIDFYLFPSTPNRKIHQGVSDLKKNSESNQATYKLLYSRKYLSILLWALDLVCRNRLRGFLLDRANKKYKFDLTHAMELNHAGYIVSSTPKKSLLRDSEIISTIWGSDIFWFGRFKSHQKRLQRILRITNTLISECARDEKLARDLEFRGTFVKSPSFFGFPKELLNRDLTPASSRKVILVKGYESFVGRASIALSALNQLQKEVQNFEIVVYSANRKTVKLVEKIRKNSGLQIRVFKKRALDQQQMLDLFEQSRIHLAVSLSDGVPSTLLEAMLSGTFPIQTNTGCAEQWVVDGKSALLVNPDVAAVKEAILRAIADDTFIDSAQVENNLVCRTKINKDKVQQELISIYLGAGIQKLT
jgi:glycosyltransferase involved in cell wall biosynthesis